MPRRIVTEKRVAAIRSDALNPIDPRQLSLPIGPRSDAERAFAIVESLQKLSGSEDVFATFEELDELPAEIVLDALATWTGPAPDPESLDPATREAHGFPPPPLRLHTLAVAKDADIFDVGEVAEEQVRTAGKLWDGLDLAAEERLDGEIEGSFAGTLEHRVLAATEDGKKDLPLFDVVLHAENAGAIFRAGTTELAGAIADGKIEMRDRRARVAIAAALAAATPPLSATEIEVEDDEDVEPETTPAPTRRMGPAAKPPAAKASTKKAAPEKAAKVSAKKAAAEKTEKTEKAAMKKASTEKVAAKKVATEKAAAKKAAAEKATAKKAAAEKATAKKASAKKAETKKTATKTKPVAKKVAAEKTAAKTTAAKKAAKKPAKKG